MRILVGGIHTECSTFNPLRMNAADFRVLRGEALLCSEHFRFLKEYLTQFLPALHVRAVPGGPVARDVYDQFKADMLAAIARAAPLDGLYLAMHGAMFVDGLEDAEGDWIASMRDAVGEECPIAVSYDLHGNLSQRIIDSIDMFSTYRTAPHIDVERTMRRAVEMLLRAIASGVRPAVAWTPVPVVLPGERTSTVDEPARGLYASLPGLEAAAGIWDASLMVGYVWADEPRATAAAVFTGTDRAALLRESEALARRYWQAREAFVFGARTGSLDQCVGWAVASVRHPFVLADSGDNPTGGGVGDRPDMLRALLAQNARDAILAGIADRAATEAAYAVGVGGSLRVPVGASLDPTGGPPVLVEGRVRALAATDGLAAADAWAERQAVIEAGGVALVVTARRRPFHRLEDFRILGLEPASARIVAVKSGYLSPELSRLAADGAMALSPGAVDQAVERLPRRRKLRPTFPFDRDFDWTPRPAASARAGR